MRARGYNPDAGRQGHGDRTRFAEELGLGGNGYNRIFKLLSGRAQPNHKETMDMLELVGWLAIPDDLSAARSGDLSVETVRELRQKMGEMAELLEQSAPAQDQRAPRRKRGASQARR